MLDRIEKAYLDGKESIINENKNFLKQHVETKFDMLKESILKKIFSLPWENKWVDIIELEQKPNCIYDLDGINFLLSDHFIRNEKFSLNFYLCERDIHDDDGSYYIVGAELDLICEVKRVKNEI